MYTHTHTQMFCIVCIAFRMEELWSKFDAFVIIFLVVAQQVDNLCIDELVGMGMGTWVGVRWQMILGWSLDSRSALLLGSAELTSSRNGECRSFVDLFGNL